MSIVIHEFEVAPRADAAPGGEPPQSASRHVTKAGTTPALLEIVRIQRHIRARALRLWAH
jgi:hypothetical protein